MAGTGTTTTAKSTDPGKMPAPLRIAYVVDPRFPGGTSSAVAAELRVTTKLGKVSVHLVESRMFNGRHVAPQLQEALDELELVPVWNAPVIAADIVLLHNPVFLKFQTILPSRIICRQIYVIAHENFERPGGHDGFDVASALKQIDKSTFALEKVIAPISRVNRDTIDDWLAHRPGFEKWTVLPDDWFNICSFDFESPTATPADRRGRCSRPGFEKFPPLEVMDLVFSPQAERNLILGADALISQGIVRSHWTLMPYRSIEVAQFYQMVDFLVYYTSPVWRESFGRVLAEAMAAGLVVITDPGTASSFGKGAIGVRPDEVDAVVARHVEMPQLYRQQVQAGQDVLTRFSADHFAQRFEAICSRDQGRIAS